MDKNSLLKEALTLKNDILKYENVSELDMTGPDVKERNTKYARMDEIKDLLQKADVEEGVNDWVKSSHLFNFDGTKAGEVHNGEVSDSIKGMTEKQYKAIKSTEYADAFNQYIRYGGVHKMADLSAVKILQEGNDTGGGFLVPEQIQATLLQKQPGLTGVMDRVARYTTGRDSLTLPRNNYTTDNIHSVPMRYSELGEIPSSSSASLTTDPTFGQSVIQVHNYYSATLVTNNMLEDSLFDMNSFLAQKFSQEYRLKMENSIINGTGLNDMTGILAGPGTTIGDQVQPSAYPLIVGTNVNNLPTAKGIVSLAYTVPEQYDNTGQQCYVFNKTNTGRGLYTIQDSNGRFLFGQGYQDSGMKTDFAGSKELAGHPYFYSNQMPNAFDTTIASGVANNYPIIFGDLTGFALVERIGLSVKVLDQLYQEVNQVKILARWRAGGQVVEDWKLSCGKISSS